MQLTRKLRIGLALAIIYAFAGVTAYLCGFASENRIELAELARSKSGFNDLLLPTMIVPWVIPSIDHESGLTAV